MVTWKDGVGHKTLKSENEVKDAENRGLVLMENPDRPQLPRGLHGCGWTTAEGDRLAGRWKWRQRRLSQSIGSSAHNFKALNEVAIEG